MEYKAKTILNQDSKEAMDFFLKSEQYHGFELPEYFVFDELLQAVKNTIADTPYEKCLRKDLFGNFHVPHIASCALTIIPNGKEPFHRSATILNWWSAMEQRSIELSLEYRYMFVTDITNCYGSVNPQAFDWAFSLKDTTHEIECKNSIPANIQKYLRAFQHGCNIGIPQGSAIFDFIGEIKLGYSDILLHEAIQREGITTPYEIIRYRDDYRIFCNDKEVLEKIPYILQHVLESINSRMNSKKTQISESIITDSIKADKLAYIYTPPIFNKKGVDFDSFENHLLYILMFARKYPNSGSIRTMLSDIDKRIEKWLKPQKREVATINLEDTNNTIEKRIETYQRKLVGGSVRAMSAVCVQIALENVGCCHYALRVLSRMVDSLEDEQEKWDIISKVYAKLCNQPNSDYDQLWLQNITYQNDKKKGTSPYNIRLCQLVANKNIEPLWDNQWLEQSLHSSLPYDSIVNRKILKKITSVITFREIRAYETFNY